MQTRLTHLHALPGRDRGLCGCRIHKWWPSRQHFTELPPTHRSLPPSSRLPTTASKSLVSSFPHPQLAGKVCVLFYDLRVPCHHSVSCLTPATLMRTCHLTTPSSPRSGPAPAAVGRAWHQTAKQPPDAPPWHCAVLVELKARFDEARNVGFATRLEEAGCNVAYGIVGIKTHAKCMLVVRREKSAEHGLRTYVHIGTGNYNPSTASLYTDLGVLSCDPQLGEDVVDVFKFLTGIHLQKAVGGFRRLLVGNQYMKGKLLELIEKEMAAARQGHPAALCVKVCHPLCRSVGWAAGPHMSLFVGCLSCKTVPAQLPALPSRQVHLSPGRLHTGRASVHKRGHALPCLAASNSCCGEHIKGAAMQVNGLDDRQMVAKLYEASAAGVRIDCIVRGVCRIRPGIPGRSENIRVVSIIGRFLEHHRIYCFYNGGKPLYYIASADWMKRNLDNRIEIAVPVRRTRSRDRLREQLSMCLLDKWAWEMMPDGSYRRPATRTDEAPLSAVMLGQDGFSLAQMEQLNLHGTQGCLMWSILQKIQMYKQAEVIF
jgi:hypothetical protein